LESLGANPDIREGNSAFSNVCGEGDLAPTRLSVIARKATYGLRVDRAAHYDNARLSKGRPKSLLKSPGQRVLG
jgi:hypothetical protein